MIDRPCFGGWPVGYFQASPWILALAGPLAGFGLSLLGMLDPARARDFLEIAGRFDSGLAFVLAAIELAGILPQDNWQPSNWAQRRRLLAKRNLDANASA
jgi:hypothetical protein